jgi:glycosyltransferase involved in cell wall biosynthesis
MKVLFINSRLDAHQNPGGDSIQIIKTKAALEQLGVSIEVRGPNNLEDLSSYEIAHVFNIQEPESTEQVFERLIKRNVPIVLSPIYWDVFAYWFESSVQKRVIWRQLIRLFGKRFARNIYTKWLLLKAPSTIKWQIQARLLRIANWVLPNSRAETLLLQDVFRLDNSFREKVDTIPNGIDPKLYYVLPVPNLAFQQKYRVKDFILQVGTINPVKNQLRVINSLFDMPCPLVFIGKAHSSIPEYVEICKTRAEERGNVIFIEHVPHHDLPGVYASAAAHVLPSWRETPGLVSLEAGATGCRVISTSIGSAREYFGDLAWYCYPDEPNTIRSAIDTALKTPPSLALRNLILEKYTWEKAAEATLVSYEKILNVANRETSRGLNFEGMGGLIANKSLK